MKHEKTFEAISKLRDVEIELHRLKNALERANKGLESQRTWVGLTDDERRNCIASTAYSFSPGDIARAIEAKLKEKNT